MLTKQPPSAWIPDASTSEELLRFQRPVRRTALGALAAAVLLAAAAPFLFAELLIVAGALLGAAVALWHPAALVAAPPAAPPPQDEPRAAPPERLSAAPTAIEQRGATPRTEEPPSAAPTAIEQRAAAPRTEEPTSAAPPAAEAPRAEPYSPPACGPRTVLVVDDHDSMLVLVNAFLADAGYRVLEADGGAAALEICRRCDGAIDLLLTDVRMPKMDGPELHRRIVERYPGVKTLFMSGFAREWAAEEGVPEGAELIEKGFTPQELQRRVKAILNGGGR